MSQYESETSGGVEMLIKLYMSAKLPGDSTAVLRWVYNSRWRVILFVSLAANGRDSDGGRFVDECDALLIDRVRNRHGCW